MKIPSAPGDTAVLDPQAGAAEATLPPTQKALRRLIERRHPEYEEKKEHWDFLEDTYEGGRDWFEDNIFRYLKEGDKEFADRLARAYRFNHTREVVDLIGKYLFKQNVTRNETDAPDAIKAFWKKATRNELPIKEFARQIAKLTSIVGRIGIVVDSPVLEAVPSKADEKKLGIAPYAYIVGPAQLLDYAYDDRGELNWVLILEAKRDDADPFNSSGETKPQYRLWDRYGWQLFERRKSLTSGRVEVVRIGEGQHNLGLVPVLLADHIITDEMYCSPAMIDDIAYLDRAVANYLSNLDAIIQDQTFSQLAMPAQNLLPGEEAAKKLVEMGTKRIFLYDGENGAAPGFLSPDVKQAQLLIEAINKIISEIYHTVGLAGERTQADNAVGSDTSSGVAKAFDFERVNALLAAKADSLESIENRLLKIVAAWAGEDEALAKIEKPLVSYPDDFDTRGLYDEFDLAARLMLVSAPDGLRRTQMEMVIDKLLPQIGAADRAKLIAELKEWPPELPDLAPAPGKPAANASSNQTRTVEKQATNPKPEGQGSKS